MIAISIPANSPEFSGRLPNLDLISRLYECHLESSEKWPPQQRRFLFLFFNHARTSAFPAAAVAVLRKSTRHTFISL